MSFIKRILLIFTCLGLGLTSVFAFENLGHDGLGQTIQINTNLTNLANFTGQPSWAITIRDLDNNQNIPYIFDITQGSNYWLLFTYGHNYMISSSNMQITKFSERYDDYRLFRITDFCHIESHGHIFRGESMAIWITGEITPSMDKIHCQVSRFSDPDFDVSSAAMNNHS